MKIAEIDKIENPSIRRLKGSPAGVTIGMYRLKGHVLRHVLGVMELKDLRDLCDHLALKRSGNKNSVVKRIWLSGKVDSLGFITST